MKIKITKMQGLGNDFVIVDEEEFKKTNMTKEDFAIKICDRNFGVGADGLIIPILEKTNEYDISWDFYNSDGTSAQMCGNGIRCFAKYVTDRGFVKKNKIRVKTLAGIKIPEIIDDNKIRVNMGKPILNCKEIPCVLQNNINQTINILDKDFIIHAISMGNPHCVIFTEENPLDNAKKYGPIIEKSKYFPEKTNVEFAKIISKKEIDMRVWERGCGITLACGTGACATTVAAILNNLTENFVKVNLAKGSLEIEWNGNTEDSVFMSGPAKYTFFAEYLL